MNNIIKRKWNQNSMVIVEDLQGMAFQAESGGHTFQISGIDGEGNAVSLSGTPAGVMLRADGQDVALTCSVSGGVVSATLPANAYSVPGRFGLTIFLTSDGQKTAIYAAVGTVGKTSSGTVAPPAGSDVVTLVNQINTAIAAIPANYNACFAPAYSTSGLYSVGQYVTYNGNLYRCNTAITTAETWTAAHWTQTNLGADVYDLKSALVKAEEHFDDSMEYESIWKYAEHIDNYKIASDGTKYVITPDSDYYLIAVSKKSIDEKGVVAFGILNSALSSVVFYTDLVTRKGQAGFQNNVLLVADIYSNLSSDNDYVVFTAQKSASVEFVPYWLNGWPNEYSAKIGARIPDDFILNNNLCLEITKFAPSSGTSGIRSYGTSLNVKLSNAIPLDATATYYSNFTIWGVVCYNASGKIYAGTVGSLSLDFSSLTVTGATHFSFIYEGLSDTDKASVVITKGNVTEYTSPKVNPKYIEQTGSKPLQGKKISFLGDSRTSYSGYVPSGNATQYPREDVQSVSDMWFYQVMQNLGMTLMVNDSWAGSTVTYGPVYWMSEDSCACNDKRSKGLDDNGTSPDVVIVWISINDFTTTENIAIGTYDGTGDFPTNKAVFSDAWSIMMKNILDTCPNARVFVCLETTIHTGAITGFVPVDSRGISIVEWNERIKELCDIFNVSVIDLSKCGITHWNYDDYLYDGIHPNKAGMKLIADYVTARILSEVY